MLQLRVVLLFDDTSFLLQEDGRFSITEPVTQDVASFRPLAPNEQHNGSPGVLCEVAGVRELDASLCEVFEDISRHEIPRVTTDLNSWKDFIVGAEPFMRREVTWADRLDPKRVLSTLVLPKDARDFLSNFETSLMTFGTRVSKVLRWRLGLRGTPNVTSRRRYSDAWSVDGGDSWLPLPFSLTASVFVHRPRILSADEIQFVSRAVERAPMLEEPIAHELLHEAAVQATSTSRSSFIMAIAAAEIGLKTYIASKVPSSAWLMENVPSPPIAKIAEEYVPQLAGEHIPAEIIATLKTGVMLRNELAHKGRAKISRERHAQTLQAVRELLLWLDAFNGHSWARRLVSEVNPATGHGRIAREAAEGGAANGDVTTVSAGGESDV